MKKDGGTKAQDTGFQGDENVLKPTVVMVVHSVSVLQPR